MSSTIELSEKYQPMFELLQGRHPEVDTVIITGGRYSLKSYTVSIFANTAFFYYAWNILYTRYTNTSIVDSVKPEVSYKLELVGIQDKVFDTKTHIEHNDNRRKREQCQVLQQSGLPTYKNPHTYLSQAKTDKSFQRCV